MAELFWLSDEQWAAIRPLLPHWRGKPRPVASSRGKANAARRVMHGRAGHNDSQTAGTPSEANETAT